MHANRRHRGIALMMVMILTAVAAVLGLSYMTASTVKLAGVQNLTHAMRAKYVAESGLLHGLWALRRDPTALQNSVGHPLGPYYVDSTADTYVFWAEPTQTAGVYVITARSTVGSLQRTASMTVKFTSAYRAAVMAQSPGEYWRLGDASPVRAAEETGATVGIYFNDPTCGQTGAIPFDANTTVDFNGGIQCIDVLNVKCNRNAFCLMAWIFPDAWPAGDMSITSKTDWRARDHNEWDDLKWLENHANSQTKLSAALAGQVDDRGAIPELWGLRVANVGGHHRLRFKIDDTTLTAGVDCPSGAWTSAAVVWTGDELILYQNGTPVGSCALDGRKVFADNGTLWIAGDPSCPSYRPWNGKIDEVAVFTKALTAQQVSDLYAARLPAVEVLRWSE